jgi:hypothetical protein
MESERFLMGFLDGVQARNPEREELIVRCMRIVRRGPVWLAEAGLEG